MILVCWKKHISKNKCCFGLVFREFFKINFYLFWFCYLDAWQTFFFPFRWARHVFGYNATVDINGKEVQATLAARGVAWIAVADKTKRVARRKVMPSKTVQSKHAVKTPIKLVFFCFGLSSKSHEWWAERCRRIFFARFALDHCSVGGRTQHRLTQDEFEADSWADLLRLPWATIGGASCVWRNFELSTLINCTKASRVDRIGNKKIKVEMTLIH